MFGLWFFKIDMQVTNIVSIYNTYKKPNEQSKDNSPHYALDNPMQILYSNRRLHFSYNFP